MNRNFKDIEMLEIPVEGEEDGDSTTSSETEGIVSDSPTTSDKISHGQQPQSNPSSNTSLSSYFSSNTE